jgi:hypothetical protein
LVSSVSMFSHQPSRVGNLRLERAGQRLQGRTLVLSVNELSLGKSFGSILVKLWMRIFVVASSLM